MNGECSLFRVPHAKCETERAAEEEGARLEREMEAVGQDVRNQCAEYADENDREPIDARYVLPHLELPEEHEGEGDGCSDGRALQSETHVDVQEIRCGLADCRAEHFDDPEKDG